MSQPQQSLQYLTISFLCEQDVALMQALAEAVGQSQCDIITTRFSYLGHHQAGFMHVSGTWITIAKLENQLKILNQAHPNTLHYQRTEKAEYPNTLAPYIVQVVGTNRTDTLANVVEFFNDRELLMIDLVVHPYHTPHTHTSMLSIQSTVLIPTNLHLAQIREAFILFCEEHNLDAMFEPDRN